MKKFLMMTTVAFLITGIAFAQDKTTEKKKCTKECCKGKECKKTNCNNKSKDVKPADTTNKS